MKKLNESILENSHKGISFSPERRAVQAQESFTNILSNLEKELFSICSTEEERERAHEEYEKLSSLYVRLYEDYYSRLGQCTSTMITGRSNYNVKRHYKKQRSADNALERIHTTLPRAVKRAKKRILPETDVIKKSDNNAVERYRAELRVLEERQTMMKESNKIIRSKKMTDNEKLDLLSKLMKPEMAQELLKPTKSWRDVGFPRFKLTNNNANIRRIKKRIEEVERFQKHEDETIEKDGLTIEVVYGENRVRLFFDSKPDQDKRSALKTNGFKWSRSLSCWSNYINASSLSFAKSL